jgi:hypothetical protein
MYFLLKKQEKCFFFASFVKEMREKSGCILLTENSGREIMLKKNAKGKRYGNLDRGTENHEH